jgi:hypothetical protein
MQRLLDLRIPFLDEAHVSGATQSLLMEAVVWTLVMLIYCNGASVVLRRCARTLPYWSLARRRGGIVCGNGRDDSILLFIFGSHHLVAGGLMLAGLAWRDATLWRHGYLLETGFEIADTLSVVIPLYPYKMDGVKAELKPAVLFHHACGTLLAYPILTTALCTNRHLQAIAMWLLLGASVSCFSGCYTYTVDTDKHILRATTAYVVNCLYFLFCRFYMFPYHSYHLLQDVKHQYSTEDFGTISVETLLRCLYVGLVCMTLFNFGIAADLIPKAIRYVMRSIDGVTPIETSAVPCSRDSIHSKRASVLLHLQRCVSATATGPWTSRRTGGSGIFNLQHVEAVVDALLSDGTMSLVNAEDSLGDAATRTKDE